MHGRPAVFVAHPIPEPALARLREVSDVEVFAGHHRDITVAELESAARRSDYIFCMHQTPVTASMVAANPGLKGYGVAARRADTQDLEALDAAGIPLLVAEETEEILDGNRRATADLMVALLLCLAYRVVEADRYSRATGYFQEMTMDLMGVGCVGKTVSLIGLGRVGRFAVPRLRALEMEVLYTKRTRLPKEQEDELGVTWVEDKDELIARGDFVSMLANYEPSNLKMMGAREFALMKPTAHFINVGRGRLVDEEAMIDALQRKVIAGAGLDVFWNEPPVVHDAYIPEALRKLDNVVLTPHNGGATWDSRGRQTLAIANAIVDDIVRRRSEDSQPASLGDRRMSIRLAVVQPITNRPPNDALNVKEAIDYVENAAANGADIVAFPESYPGPWRMPASFDAIKPMVQIANQCNVYVQFGTLEPINPATGEAYQLAVLAYPDGRSPGIYRRTHPPGPWLYTGGVWEFQYVAADDFPVFATEHGTVGMGVCSEVYMPEVCRALALRGAEIIFLPAGIAKPELWETWRTLIWARAIENLAVVVTTQNLFSREELGLAMVATPAAVLLQSVTSGVFYADFDLDEARRLRSEEDSLASKNAAKAGVLTQWQRPELRAKVFPDRS